MTSEHVWNKKTQTVGLFEKLSTDVEIVISFCLNQLPLEPEGKKQKIDPREGRSSSPNEEGNREMGRRKGKQS